MISFFLNVIYVITIYKFRIGNKKIRDKLPSFSAAKNNLKLLRVLTVFHDTSKNRRDVIKAFLGNIEL